MPEKRCDASTLMVVTVLMSPMYTFAVAPHLAAADSLYLQHGEKLSKEGWPRRRPQRRWQQARHWEAQGGRAAVAIAKVERGAKAKPEAEAMKRKAQDRCGDSGLRRVTRSRAAATRSYRSQCTMQEAWSAPTTGASSCCSTGQTRAQLSRIRHERIARSSWTPRR